MFCEFQRTPNVLIACVRPFGYVRGCVCTSNACRAFGCVYGSTRGGCGCGFNRVYHFIFLSQIYYFLITPSGVVWRIIYILRCFLLPADAVLGQQAAGGSLCSSRHRLPLKQQWQPTVGPCQGECCMGKLEVYKRKLA